MFEVAERELGSLRGPDGIFDQASLITQTAQQLPTFRFLGK